MKKVIAFLILAIMLVSTAYAESGYVSIKEAISNSIGVECFVQEISTGQIPDEHVVSILFYPWKNEVTLVGKNADNQFEGCIWETELCTLLLGGYCGSWDALVDSLEEGYQLNIILQASEDDELLLIDTLEKAEYMYSLILDGME